MADRQGAEAESIGLLTMNRVSAAVAVPVRALRAGRWGRAAALGLLLASPAAAEDAAEYIFHPDQKTERTADGALVVRFRAGGALEMSWHLQTWGDAVEVLEPFDFWQRAAASRSSSSCTLAVRRATRDSRFSIGMKMNKNTRNYIRSKEL